MVFAPSVSATRLNRIASAPSGGSPTKPLTDQLAAAIGLRWVRGGNFGDIADAVVNAIAETIRQNGIRGQLDPRLADAIADAISAAADADYAPAPIVLEHASQLTLADILEYDCPQCRDARRNSDPKGGWCAVCNGSWIGGAA